jgi:hypothetical protein
MCLHAGLLLTFNTQKCSREQKTENHLLLILLSLISILIKNHSYSTSTITFISKKHILKNVGCVYNDGR